MYLLKGKLNHSNEMRHKISRPPIDVKLSLAPPKYKLHLCQQHTALNSYHLREGRVHSRTFHLPEKLLLFIIGEKRVYSNVST